MGKLEAGETMTPSKYIDGTERRCVDCPSCKMQRWIDADCHHCGNSAVSCLKHLLAALQQENERLKQSQTVENVSDGPCKEADGCPTETAVLKREWRKQRTLLRELIEALEGYMRVHGSTEGHCFHVGLAALARAEEALK